MKKVCVFLLLAAMAVSLAACGGAAENKTANTTANTNTAKPAPAAPSADTLLTMDKAANEAWSKSDPSWFEQNLSDKFVMIGDKGKRLDRAGTIEMIKTGKCDIKNIDLTEPQLAKIDADTYVLSYKGAFDGTCTMGGKTQKMPSPMRAASVWVRGPADKWMAAWHGETPIMEPAKADVKKADATKGEAKKGGPKDEAAKADTAAVAQDATSAAKEVAKKEEPKKEEAKKAAPMKEEAKKPETKKDEKAAAPAEAMKPDPNTDALTKIHQTGWEAWRDKDSNKLRDITASSLSFVSADGKWYGTKDEVINSWVSMDCKDVKNVKVADGFASPLSPTMEIFTSTGTADGTCDGRKNGTLYASSIYVKEGNDWKLAFMFESPKM
jgi:hypothetical protein